MFNLNAQLNIFVVDMETFGILCSCDNAAVANAISSGIINSTVMTVHLHREDLKLAEELSKKYRQDFNKCIALAKDTAMTAKFNGPGLSYKPINEDTKTLFSLREIVPEDLPRWVNKKKLADLKRHILTEVYSYCSRYLAKEYNHINTEMMITFANEVMQDTNPTENLKLLLWAELTQQTPDYALSELKFIKSNYEFSHLKAEAAWRSLVKEVTEADLYNIKSLGYYLSIAEAGIYHGGGIR